ncbi:MAG: acyl-CoA dehydrogenase, partial [Mycobacterium sp.]
MTQQIERTEVEAVRPALPYVELTGFEVLNDEERGIQQAMHKFAHDVMRPAGIAIDKLSAEEAVAPDSP